MSIKMTVFTFALSAFLLLASTVTLQAELVGYWNFDGNVDDLSGLENHGELIDAVYSDDVPDAIGGGQSLDFSFDTDHVFIANENGIGFGRIHTVHVHSRSRASWCDGVTDQP